MNPETLQSILIKGDTVFSKDIKETIFKDGLDEILAKKDKKNMEGMKHITPTYGANDFKIKDILFILEMGSLDYWMWSTDQQTFSGYNLEDFTGEINHALNYINTDDECITDCYLFSEKTLVLVKEIVSNHS